MAFLRLFSTCLLLIISISCNKTEEPPITTGGGACGTTATVKPSIFIGDNDWVDYTLSGDELQNINERTVALVKIPAMMANCTGFLINSDTIITNNHCISNAVASANVTAIFRDSDGTRTTYSCNQFIMTSTLYDFTLVRCSNSPGDKFGWVGLSKTKPELFTPIYVVQENCDYFSDPRCIINKYVAYGEVLKSQLYRVNHDADTLGGSSGSPIFSEDTHQVIALHNAGSPATSTEPAMNAGVPMFQIVKHITANSSVTIHEFGTVSNAMGSGSGTGSGTGTGPGSGSGSGSGSNSGTGTGSGTNSGTGPGSVEGNLDDTNPITTCPPSN